MKHKLLSNSIVFPFILCLTVFNSANAQDKKKFYSTTGGEMIFSWADAKRQGEPATTIVRFSPVFNFQYQLHRDLTNRIGLVSGVNIRNVGFIFDDPKTVNTRYKARVYALGIPIALKLGNMRGAHLFGGYEVEFPFNYKEKKFINEVKEEKNTSWFSDKVPAVYQSFYFGVQTVFGAQLKFKYYMTNFFNKSYTADDGAGNITHPYADIEANVMYISLSFQILKGSHSAYEN